MNKKMTVIGFAAVMALASAPAFASHLTGPGLHGTITGGHQCTDPHDYNEDLHYAYGTGGAVVKATVGTTRQSGASITQIHDECQDDNPLYNGDNEYEWGVNGAFLWTEEHNQATADLPPNEHDAGPAFNKFPLGGVDRSFKHHNVAAAPATCNPVTGTPPVLTCTWSGGSPATVETLLILPVAFSVGADVNGNGVVSGGYPDLEPTYFGWDPATSGGTPVTPRQSCAIYPPSIGTTNITVCGSLGPGEGPGYDDGYSDVDRAPNLEGGGVCGETTPPESLDPTSDCPRANPAGNEHGWWVFVRTTVDGDRTPPDVAAASLYARIWG